MKIKFRFLLTGIALMFAGSFVNAEITYDKNSNTIIVSDFPEDLPCDLRRLAFADCMYDWGVVSYDEASATCVIKADLRIGANDGTNTYFQIGRQDRQQETLLIDGNVIVYPYWIKGENSGKSSRYAEKYVNRLTLGDPDNKNICANLKFNCQSRSQYALYVGAWPTRGGKIKRGYLGQLHVYNSVITSAVQDKEHAFGAKGRPEGNYIMGDSVIFDHASISWVAGAMAYGMKKNIVKDCILEHIDIVMLSGKRKWSGCEFRSCGVGVRDWGSLDAVLTNCIFKNNEVNWDVTMSKKGLVCVDCELGTPSKSNIVRRSKFAVKKENYPKVLSRRHVIIEVKDQEGNPVKGAKIKIENEQDDFLSVTNREQVTDKLGRTEGREQKKAVLLTDVAWKGNQKQQNPKPVEYSYRIHVNADGFEKAVQKNVKPSTSWKVITIVLKNKKKGQ